MQGVTAVPRVRQRSQSDVHGVRLRAHDADVRVYDISVNTCCGNFRASVVLSRWVMCGVLERHRVCVPFLETGGRVRPILHVPWDAVVHRIWAAHHVRNFGQVARVDAL